MTRTFPPGFVFGAATAAYQVEGAAHEDGRTDSIWDAFCRVPGAVFEGDNGDVACDQYHRYPQDVALMGSLGLQAYRLSASWARVRPDGGAPNAAGLDYYGRLVDELLGAGITPWVTLYHWDLPQALEERGGWTNRDTAYRFADYAGTLFDTLGDRVTHWITLNEPWCSAFLGYAAGVHAPGRRDAAAAVTAGHHLLLGHGLALERLRETRPEHSVGITLNLTVADPATDSPADGDAADRIDAQANRFFLDPLFGKGYPAAAPAPGAEVVLEGDLGLIAAPIDFLGVNYYHGDAVGFEAGAGDAHSPFTDSDGITFPRRGLPVTAMDWEVQPEGLTRLLVRLQADYTGERGIPLYITENGAAYDDEIVDAAVADPERTAFLEAHLAAALDAIDAGVDLRGYFYWSLLDNFEWAYGYAKRFGIVRVDYDTQERTVKASGKRYRQIIAARGL